MLGLQARVSEYFWPAFGVNGWCTAECGGVIWIEAKYCYLLVIGTEVCLAGSGVDQGSFINSFSSL